MKRGTTDHPKIDELCAVLNLRRYEAVGILNTLWDWAGRYVPQGNIGKYTNRVIAKQIEWERDPDELIRGLVESKWIDEHPDARLIIHDWPEHCEDSTHTQLARQVLLFADGSMPKLTKLSEKERLALTERYKYLKCADVRTSAQNGAETRPTITKPEPEPIHGDAREARSAPDTTHPPAHNSCADPEEIIPDGLAKVQYATFVLERLPAAAHSGLKIQTGDGIELIARTEGCTLAVATRRMLDRMRAAKRDGPVKWNLWLSDGLFAAEAGRKKTLSVDVPQTTWTDEAVAARERQRELERAESYRMWSGMSEAYRKKNPWSGSVPTRQVV